MGREVNIVTNCAGSSVNDMKGMKTNAPMIIRKTVAVAFIVSRITALEACQRSIWVYEAGLEF
jgi:hypothetical protein